MQNNTYKTIYLGKHIVKVEESRAQKLQELIDSLLAITSLTDQTNQIIHIEENSIVIKTRLSKPKSTST